GKLTRISKEEDGFLTVKERAQWKAVVTNVPQYAQEEKAIESRASYFNIHLYWKQEEKYRTSQRSEDMRDRKGKVLAEADQRTRRQHKEIKNREKLGKQDRKRCEEQGRKTIIE
ncbi:456_t:CDS:2, partial [Gigaspora rosea]